MELQDYLWIPAFYFSKAANMLIASEISICSFSEREFIWSGGWGRCGGFFVWLMRVSLNVAVHLGVLCTLWKKVNHIRKPFPETMLDMDPESQNWIKAKGWIKSNTSLGPIPSFCEFNFYFPAALHFLCHRSSASHKCCGWNWTSSSDEA